MAFHPELFIGIGETSAYYTLRETYLHEQWVGGQDGYMAREVRSYHHFNLSQDIDEAIAKAKAASEMLGHPLCERSTRENLECEMRDIKRATAEEMEAKRAREAAQRAQWEAERQVRKAEAIAQLETGLITFGKYKDQKIETLSPNYLQWVASKAGEFEEGSLMRELARIISAKYAHLLPVQPLPELHIGPIGERLTLKVKVSRVYAFQRPVFGAEWKNETCYIVTMITDSRACIVSKSVRFAPNEGEELSIKATIKAHDTYKGQAQTVVQRIKVLQ